MAQTHHERLRGSESALWVDLVDSYNAARIGIAALATVSSTVVGFINGWPRGPWVLLVAASNLAHAVHTRIRRVRRATMLLIVDALALGVATSAMGILTVTRPESLSPVTANPTATPRSRANTSGPEPPGALSRFEPVPRPRSVELSLAGVRRERIWAA